MTALSPAFPLSWRSDTVGGAVIVTVEGELDRHTAPVLGNHLHWVLAGGPARLVLDTERVSFADVGAFDMLADIGRSATARGCAVVITAPGPALQRLTGVLRPPPGVTLERW